MSDFKVAREPNIQNWLEINIFQNAKWLQKAIMGQGTFLLTLEIIVLILGFIKLASKFKKSKTLVDNLKKKIMWSSVFRGQIQFYFPVAVVIIS